MSWPGVSPALPYIGTSNWSARFTGYVRLDTASAWKFRIGQGDGARLWIDDRLIVNSWGEIYGNSEFGTFNVAAGETGWHRIRVDMFERGGNNALLEVHATPPGGSEFNLQGQYLSPGYDRVTKQTSLDDTGVPSNVAVTDYNYQGKLWLGLVNSVTVDPGGLGLTTQYTYDSANWHRAATKVMPGGNTWQYTYWGANDVGTCGSAAGVAQMGRLRRVQHPGTTSPLFEETEYNLAGAPQVTKQWTTGGQVNRTCTETDGRNRVWKRTTSNATTGAVWRTD